MLRFTWHDDNRAEVIEMWSDGRTITEIANHFSITRSMVSGFLSRNRDVCELRKPSARPSLEEIEVPSMETPSVLFWDEGKVATLRKLMKQGETASHIASMLGCSRSAVLAKAHRLAIPFNVKRKDKHGATYVIPSIRVKWTDDLLVKASRLWKEERPAPAICALLNLPSQSLKDAVARYPQYFPKRNSWKGRPQPSAPVDTSMTGYRYDSTAFSIEGVVPIRFADTTDQTCKFPISCEDSPKGADMPCCGAEVTNGSYCQHHYLISRGRGTQSERTAVRVLARAGQ